MKKYRFSGIFAGVCLLAALILPGCGGGEKITAEELMEQVSANVEKVSSMDFGLGMNIAMSVGQSGVNMDLSIEADFDVEATREPEATHMSGTLSMSVMGLSVDMEQYTVEEDGKTVTYSGSAGQWTRTEADAETDDQMASISSMFDDAVSYELQEDTEKVDGKTVYVLNGQISGDVMEDLMGEMSGAMEGLPSEDMDWSAFEANVTIKVDEETKLPVEALIDMGDGLSSMMESALGSESADVELSVDEYTMTVTYNSFDDVAEIVVPDDVKASAVDGAGDTEDDSLEDFLGGDTGIDTEESTDPAESQTEESTEEETIAANADGTYTLNSMWGEGSVNIAAPQGYELNPYSDSSYLSFTDTFGQDFDEIYVSYMLESDYTDEDMTSYYMDDISYYQENEDYTDVTVQEKQTVNVAGRDVSYIKVSYTFDEDGHYVEYYAWTQLADGNMVDCNVEEYAYGQEPALLTDDMTVLETMFSVISE